MAQEEEIQQYNWPATLAFLGGLTMFFLWRRRRRRKRLEKMVRKFQRRSEARPKKSKAQRKELSRTKPVKRKAHRRRKREEKKTSMASQLVRFAVFQLLKKIISQQIDRIELDLQKSPLGARLASVSKPGEATA